jgi:hypothetical protein
LRLTLTASYFGPFRGRKCLEDIYGWFTEGAQTPELLDAKALLEEL